MPPRGVRRGLLALAVPAATALVALGVVVALTRGSDHARGNFRVLSAAESRTLLAFAGHVRRCLAGRGLAAGAPEPERVRILIPLRRAYPRARVAAALVGCGRTLGDPPSDASLQLRRDPRTIYLYLPKQCLLDPKVGSAQIAFTSTAGPAPAVYIVDVATGRRRRLYLGGSDAAWAPDGTRLAVAGTGGANGIFVVGPDGRGRLIPGTVGGGHPAWSPDGRWLVFPRAERRPGGREGLYLIRRDGTDLRRLLLAPRGSLFLSPVWRPAG